MMGVIFINIDYKLNCLAGTGQLLITLILVKLELFQTRNMIDMFFNVKGTI